MLSFSDKDNITKFLEIGFALKSHQKRLEKVVENFKSKAWEITLVKIAGARLEFFRMREVNILFSYLCKRSVHHRLATLIDRGYIIHDRRGYYLTLKGIEKAKFLKNSVRITKLRTNSVRNESQILSYIMANKTSYRNELARNLEMNTATVRDVLNRLKKKNKIKLTKIDKFQRKFYKVI